MSDDVTNAELARRLEHFHRDLHGDLQEVKQQLAQYVLQAVYNAEMAGRDKAFAALEARVKEAEDQRRTLLRWAIGAIVVPVVMLIVQIALAVRGPT